MTFNKRAQILQPKQTNKKTSKNKTDFLFSTLTTCTDSILNTYPSRSALGYGVIKVQHSNSTTINYPFAISQVENKSNWLIKLIGLLVVSYCSSFGRK